MPRPPPAWGGRRDGGALAAHRGKVLSADLPLVVVDRVVELEQLPGRPGAYLVRVGIDRRRRMRAVRPDEDARRLVAAVRHLVRTGLTHRAEGHVPGAELAFAVRCSHGRPSRQDNDPLLLAALVVVRAHALARGQLDDVERELRRPEFLGEAQEVARVTGRVVVVVLELDIEQVHVSPSQYGAASPSRPRWLQPAVRTTNVPLSG